MKRIAEDAICLAKVLPRHDGWKDGYNDVQTASVLHSARYDRSHETPGALRLRAVLVAGDSEGEEVCVTQLSTIAVYVSVVAAVTIALSLGFAYLRRR